MTEILYSFRDICLMPNFSHYKSRKDADTSAILGKFNLKSPIISAPMDSVSGEKMMIALWKSGAIGCLHRFWTIEENVEEYKNVRKKEADCIVSVGASENEKKRFEMLFEAGARAFCLDVAHGHSIHIKEMLSWIKKEFWDALNLTIIAGNVCSEEGTADLVDWGADVVRVGVGGGSVCKTSVVTGFGIPLFSTILKCSKIAHQKGKKIIADGGIRSSGDMVKAFVAGADYCMIGNLLKGTEETPGETLVTNKGVFKKFRGMASEELMNKRQNQTFLPASEGISVNVPCEGSVEEIIKNIVKGIKSGMSYGGVFKVEEFKNKVKHVFQETAA